MSDILDEEDKVKKVLPPLESVIKFEEGEEEYGLRGCIIPLITFLFLGYLLWKLIKSLSSI
jgi:hypothetical protein